MEPNKVALSLKDNPEWAAAFAGCSAGDTVRMTIEFVIDESAVDMVVGSIDECEDVKITEGPDNDENESSEDASSDIGKQNVLAVMAPGYKGKK